MNEFDSLFTRFDLRLSVVEYYWAEPSFIARRKNLIFFFGRSSSSAQIRSLHFKSTPVHLLPHNL